MGCFGKSDDEIASRRSAKRGAVRMLLDAAQLFPKTAIGGEAISSVDVRRVAIPWGEFWQTMSVSDRTTLATGKGCNTRPAGATNYMALMTLRDFIKKGAEHPYVKIYDKGKETIDPDGIGCWGGYLKDGYHWAQQVMRDNPHAFAGMITLRESMQLVDEALINQDREAGDRSLAYRTNPTFPPRASDELPYYGAFVAGRCFAEQKDVASLVKDGDDYRIEWGPRENLNKARSKFNKEIRQLEEDLWKLFVQVSGYELEDCVNRWAKWYHTREVPLDEYI